jgi:hypothetical protein
MIISVVYLLARYLLGCLMMLTQRQVSKEAELLVLRHETRYSAARSARSATSRALLWASGQRSVLPGHSHPGGAGLAASARRAAAQNLLVMTAARAPAG